MTRETKIGLLVGLAFIIVFGILLSEYSSSTTEPAPAPLASAGQNVRLSYASGPSPATPATTPSPTDPHQLLPVHNQGDTLVGIDNANDHGGAGDGPGLIQRVGVELFGEHHESQPPSGPQPAGPTNVPPTGPPVNSNVPTDLQNAANIHNQQLVSVNPNGGVAMAATLTHDYTAKEGDTLSKLAGRLLGKNTKANRDAIVSLNPSLKANPDRVIVGQTYKIPAAAAAGSTAATQQPASHPDHAPSTGSSTAQAPAPAAGAATVWYTVKPSDNLWRIAASQLGDGKRWREVQELNRDILKGRDAIHADMRLRLPAKAAVAAANG